MATDVREAILARLEEVETGTRRTSEALRLALDLHQPEPWHHGEPHAEADHMICQDVGMEHPRHRCAGCSELDDDGSGLTVGYPCRELAVIAGALGVPIDREVGL